MGVLRIYTDPQNFGSQGAEFFDSVAKSDQFSWADESEIERVKDEDDVLSLEIGKGNLLDFAIDDGISSEIWSRVGDWNIKRYINMRNEQRVMFFVYIERL